MRPQANCDFLFGIVRHVTAQRGRLITSREVFINTLHSPPAPSSSYITCTTLSHTPQATFKMSCTGFLPTFSLFGFARGITSHLLYFIHSELDSVAGAIATTFLSLFAALVAVFPLYCGSLLGIITACTLAISFLSGLGSSIVVYRLLFHRLASYSGPVTAAVSKWSAAFIAHRTQRYHAEVCEMHRRYGDVIRTGPRELSINTVEAIQPIYGQDSACRKGPWYDLGGTGLNLHRTRDPELHAMQRPFWERGIRGNDHHQPEIGKADMKSRSYRPRHQDPGQDRAVRKVSRSSRQERQRNERIQGFRVQVDGAVDLLSGPR